MTSDVKLFIIVMQYKTLNMSCVNKIEKRKESGKLYRKFNTDFFVCFFIGVYVATDFIFLIAQLKPST